MGRYASSNLIHTGQIQMIVGKLLILLLPLLLSLAGQGGIPKLLCPVLTALALLVSFEPVRAMLPSMLFWAAGMAIAVISVRERIHRLRAAGVRHLK